MSQSPLEPGVPVTVLIVEDEPPLQKFLRAALETCGHRTIITARGQEALRHAATAMPDLVILDLGLPDMDGLEVLRQLRQWTSMPVVVISARGREADKIAALDAGADDYLTKPFGVGELLARMRAALRHRWGSEEPGQAVFQTGNLRIDFSRRQASVAGRHVHLTRNEFNLLATLARNAGKVMTHRQLLREVWGPGSAEEHHYVRVYMNQLRQKLESDPARPEYLLTETGVGYRMSDDPPAGADHGN